MKMTMTKKTFLSLGLGLLLLSACDEKKPEVKQEEPVTQNPAPEVASASTEQPAEEAGSEDKMIEESRKYGHVPIAGQTSREAVLEKFGTWRAKMDEVEANQESAEALKSVPPGAKVTVLFGTWCSDCYNTLPAMWKTFDAMGQEVLPFEVEYIAVNERLQAEGMDLSTYDLRNIPTIVVTRDGKEVGRFIEKSSEPAEVELEALLTGKKTGVLSTNAKIVEHYGLDKK